VGSSTGKSAGFAPFRIRSTKYAARCQPACRSGPKPSMPPASANAGRPIAGSRFFAAIFAIASELARSICNKLAFKELRAESSSTQRNSRYAGPSSMNPLRKPWVVTHRSRLRREPERFVTREMPSIVLALVKVRK
jgi:hypothetical protein